MAVQGRKNKQVLLDFDSHVKEISRQFIDQIKCLDARTENKLLLLSDIIEFLRKRAEVESEYAKNLDRLADRFQDRTQKQRSLYGFSKKEKSPTLNLWNKLLIDTKFKSKTCSSLSDLFLKNLVTRLQDMTEDVQRISKSVKETHFTLQDEVMRQVQRLQQSIKVYYNRDAEYQFAESKLRDTEQLKQRVEESPNKKGNEKRIRNLDKVKEKHHSKYVDTKLKSTRARNEYLLTLEATSAVLSKYYDHDINDIILRSDHNYYNSFAATLKAYCGSEQRMANSFVHAANSLEMIISTMDPEQDRLHFLEDQKHTFGPVVKFAFLGHTNDQVNQITAVGKIQGELDSEHEKLYNNIKQLQVEIMELKEGMADTTKTLEETYKQYDNDVNSAFHMDALSPTGPLQGLVASSMNSQIKSNKEEHEKYLLGKFREFILTQNLNTEKQARYDILTKALREILPDLPGRQATNLSGKPTASQTSLPSVSAQKNPIKLFGTRLEDHVKDAGNDIPEIVESCVKFITKFGLHHQGIFRVPGTAQDIADMKKAFEDGRNPLAGLNHWKDINAVGGVFRAYFRELSEPLFPSEYFQEYLKISRMLGTDEQIVECRNVMQRIPDVNLAVIKYLLKFLHMISTNCEHNRMNAHNLAVVFGPTVIRVPDNEDLITNQGQVNVFIEIIINEFYALFPNEYTTDGPPPEDEENEGEQSEDEVNSEEEQDTEYFEAEALYDFAARSAKELSFKKGDQILVFSRTNENWWDAQVNGQNGFVPARYVRLLSTESEKCDSEGSGRSSRRQTGEIIYPETVAESYRSPTETDSSINFTTFGQSRKMSDSSDVEQSWPEPPSEKQITLKVDLQETLLEKSQDSSPPPLPSPSLDVTSTNLFSSIDPTCSQYQSGVNPPRRAFSEKSATLYNRTTVSAQLPRLVADKSKTMSLKHGAATRKDSEGLKEETLASTLTAVREAFSGPRVRAGNTPRMVAAVLPMQISNKDILETQSKLKPGPVEELPPKPSESPPDPPGDFQTRASVKDRSKIFGAPPLERNSGRRAGFMYAPPSGVLPDCEPQSMVTLKRASFSNTIDEPPARLDDVPRSPSAASVDQGRYQAPAVKPKPKQIRKSQSGPSNPELIATINAAAAAVKAKSASESSS